MDKRELAIKTYEEIQRRKKQKKIEGDKQALALTIDNNMRIDRRLKRNRWR